ncbi:MAG: YihY/virulence factor BrkB family protein [Tissierellia bacterium]|nr:YihY/virulence factor BrkB family protein [Tissierellia bacterium]
MKERDTKIDGKIFLRKFISGINEDEMIGLAAQSAYHFIVAIVPFLIVFINIALFFAANNLNAIQRMLFDFLPEETVAQISPIVDNIIANRAKGGLSVVLGLLVALWSSSNAINALIKALNKAFNVNHNQSFLTTKGKSIIFTLLIVMIMLLVIFFLIFGDLILDTILGFIHWEMPSNLRLIFQWLKYIIPIGGMILGFTLFYKKAPHFDETHHITWKSAFTGGCMTSIGWVLISVIYSYYTTSFSNMPLQYGPLFGIFAMFVWLYLTSMIIIASAEFISVYDQMKKGIFVSN